MECVNDHTEAAAYKFKDLGFLMLANFTGMDGSVMGPAMFSGSSPGLLELEPSSLHHPSSFHHQQPLVHNLQGLAPLSTTQHVNVSQDTEQALGLETKGTANTPLIYSKGKPAGTSDEDEPSFTEDGGDGVVGWVGNKKNSPWHRMKWTDSMVKLLINIVLVVGEDGVADTTDGNNKRKCGVLQKKGKWRSVSRLMMDRGCFVSPQQCEDKFNDLNKRYKRLNDILGKEAARFVVENPSLLDTMSNMSQKTKEDVKKILSSKHLFYKEMCFYHSGCKSLGPLDVDFQLSIQPGTVEKSRELIELGRPLKEENDLDDEEEEGDGEDEDEGDYDDEDEDDHDDKGTDGELDGLRECPSPFGKRRRYQGSFGLLSDYAKGINMDVMNNDLMMMMMASGSKLTPEQWQRISIHMLQLEEQKVALQAQAIELEKQRFKWQKSSSRKERENEKTRLETERMKLENERVSLQLKQKELEIEFNRSETSITSISLILERLQSKEQNDVGCGQGMYGSNP